MVAAPEQVITPLLRRAVDNLELTWRGDALFPYSTRLVDGGLVHDYEHPHTLRYTINSLLGLRAFGAPGAEEKVDAFVRLRLPEVTNPGDLGLAAVLLGDAVALDGLEPQTMQERCWLLWGALATGRGALAEKLYRGLDVHPASGLPLHSRSLHRRRLVSFGAIVYFLKALREYADATGDERAAERFRSGVERMLAIQGPRGEWPWMIDVASGIPLDVYPVFAVHQDAMAMLFLHPALDLGFAGVPEAIERSFAWTLGENELGLPMYVDDPFFAYRSIERVERAPRLRRYSRSFLGGAAAPAAARVRLNAECRSYHLGWLLYAWSARVV